MQVRVRVRVGVELLVVSWRRMTSIASVAISACEISADGGSQSGTSDEEVGREDEEAGRKEEEAGREEEEAGREDEEEAPQATAVEVVVEEVVEEVEEVEEAEEACPFTVALAAPLAALWIGASRSAAATRLALLDAAWARSAA